MKKTFTSYSLFFCFLLTLSFSNKIQAQAPANDRCENATTMMLAADEASIVYVDGDTRMTEDATLIQANYPLVCSGSWYTDDVWFSVTTGATVPENGITIQCETGSVATDVVDMGMGFYSSCDAGIAPIDCFSDAPGRRTIVVPPSCLVPNNTYYARIWSAGSPTGGSGTFRIGAYINDQPLFFSPDIVIWSEDFENGFGDWSTTSQTDTAEVWRYYEVGNAIPNAFGGSEDLTTSRSACSNKVGFPGGWYQTFMTGNSDTIPPNNADYIDLNSDLISPAIDLSAVTVPVSLKFDQTARKLNPNAAGNPHLYVSFSYDDGVTWADTVEVNPALAANDPAAQDNQKVNLGSAATGSSAVRVKFTYDMDFYYWIIDNVEIVEREAHNLRANENWYAVAHNALTPKHQVSPIGFMVDIENIGAQEQTNANLNMTIVDDATQTVVFTDDLDYGSIPGGALIENQIMANYFTPDDQTTTTYTGTYSITADSMDFDDTNNEISFGFEVSDSTFAREFGENLAGITPADAAVINWSYGAYYYVPNGETHEVTSVLFNLQNAAQVAGGTVNVTLYQWEDQNDDGDAQANERGVLTATPPITGQIIANTSHTIDTADTDVLLTLENWDDETLPVLLSNDAHYILVCAFNSPAGSTTQIAVGSTSGDNNNTDYEAMNFVQNTAFQNPFYSTYFGSEATFEADLTASFFWAPRIRMHVNPFDVNTENVLSEANKINVFPNPAADFVNVKLDLEEIFDNGFIKITDATGKTLSMDKYNEIQNEIYSFDISQYAAGTYFVQFITDKGSRTQRFTIVR